MSKVPAMTLARPLPAPPMTTLPGSAIDFRSYFKVETYPSGAIIYRPGDAADRVFLIRSGRVRLLRPPGSTVGQEGAEGESVHALLRAGDLFGETLRPAEATMEEFAVANGETEVWSIEGQDLKALVEARPPLALEIIRALSERVRSMRRRVNALTFKEVPARLAEALLVLGETHGERCPHGGEIDLRGITQQDLADLVGASRSFVSTLINEMKRDGILGNVGRVLCIRNQRELRRLAAKDRV
jgi:CRP-like cAMP-binding protein